MDIFDFKETLSTYSKCSPYEGGGVERDFSNGLYDNDIIDIIDTLESNDIFPYNRTVEEETRKLDKFKDLSDDEIGFLVYFSQTYRRAKRTMEKFNEWDNDTKEYVPFKDIELDKYLNKKKYFILHSFDREPMKVRVIKDAEGKIFFLKPRYKVRGYQLGRFISPKVENIK